MVSSVGGVHVLQQAMLDQHEALAMSTLTSGICHANMAAAGPQERGNSAAPMLAAKIAETLGDPFWSQ